MAVRQWLAARPYDRQGFLGWHQAWKYMLGMVMFLISETSRTVRTAYYIPGALLISGNRSMHTSWRKARRGLSSETRSPGTPGHSIACSAGTLSQTTSHDFMTN